MGRCGRILARCPQVLQIPNRPGALPDRRALRAWNRVRKSSRFVTSIALKASKGNVLRARGLDALNGTSVLDIKPV
jgi:hypothetical protein